MTTIKKMAEQVREAIEDLKSEYRVLSHSIFVLKENLRRLKLMPVPIDDLQQFFVDYVDARGQDFLPTLEAELARFVNPQRAGMPGAGHPITFEELEFMLGEEHDSSRAPNHPQSYVRMLRPNVHRLLDDCFYLFFGEAIKAALPRIFDSIELRYKNASLGIGSDRDTRRTEIAEIETNIKLASKRLLEIAGELKELGGTTPTTIDFSPPETAIAIARLIGPAQAVRFVKSFAQKPVRIPETIELANELEAAVGRDGTQKLIERFGGFVIEASDAWLSQLKTEIEEAALTRARQGADSPTIARYLEIPESEVNQILQAARRVGRL